MSFTEDQTVRAAPELDTLDDERETGGVDAGLFVLRAVVGLLLAGHGAQKLFGWFGGTGLPEWERVLNGLGYDPAHWFALAHAIVELAAGAFLILGLLTPLAAAALIGVMVNAIPTKLTAGFWIQDNGPEYEIVLLAVGITLAMTGAGMLSLDRRTPWVRGGLGSAIFGLIVGFGVGAAVYLIKGGFAGYSFSF